MKVRIKRRIVDIIMSSILLSVIITAESEWWVWSTAAVFAAWNFYAGMACCDLWRDV